MKLVVITGCLGLIGNYVTRKCLSMGWKVYGIDKITYAANLWALEEFKQNKNFVFLQEDICDIKNIPDCDYVINLAAESHVENSITNNSQFIKTNIVGVQNLLNIIKDKHDHVFKKPVFFHFSTDEVYGDIKSGSFKETDILNPSNPYSGSKAAADMLILSWARTYNINYIIIRPTNNYGIGQHSEKFIPVVIKMLQLERKINLHDEGNPVRNWLHAEDTANAVIEIIKSKKINEIYNISGNLEQKNIVTATQILKEFFKKETINENEFFNFEHKRVGQDFRYSLDDSKLKKLGWTNKKHFLIELPGIVQHYKENFKW